MRSNSPARRIIVAEAALATAGAGPRERSVSMVARLPWSPAGVQLRRPWSCVADLGGGTGRGLAWPLGREPDADQRVDAQAQARRAAARRRSASNRRRRHLKVGSLTPVRGAVGRTAGRVDGI